MEEVLFFFLGLPVLALISGSYCSASILASKTPEANTITSYLELFVNLGAVCPIPLAAILLHGISTSRLVYVVYALLTLQFVLALLLSFYWNTFVSFGGGYHSVPLFCLIFLIGGNYSLTSISTSMLVSKFKARCTSMIHSYFIFDWCVS
jgi:hypothetical protein